MVALAQFNFQLFAHVFVHFVVIIQLVKIIHKLLIVLYGKVRLHLLHILNLFFITPHLFLHFLQNFVTCGISLFYVVVTTLEFIGLRLHRRGKILLLLNSFIFTYLVKILADAIEQIHISLILLRNFLKNRTSNKNFLRVTFHAIANVITCVFELVFFYLFLLVVIEFNPILLLLLHPRLIFSLNLILLQFMLLIFFIY